MSRDYGEPINVMAGTLRTRDLRVVLDAIDQTPGDERECCDLLVRIAVCVNACAGLDDPAVELARLRAISNGYSATCVALIAAGIKSFGYAAKAVEQLAAERDSLKEQRDELKGALLAIYDRHNPATMERARAALAKIKGE